MPFIGWLIGDIDLSYLNIVLKEAVMDGETVVTPAVVIGIGTFISTVIDFIIIALIVFAIVKLVNRMNRKKEAEPETPPAEPEPTKEELLLSEIRDILKDR